MAQEFSRPTAAEATLLPLVNLTRGETRLKDSCQKRIFVISCIIYSQA